MSDKIGAKRITQITSFASGLFALFVLIILDISFNVDLKDIPIISVLTFVGTGIATLFFVMTLRLLCGVRTILLYSTAVIFGILFSIIVLSEEITIMDMFSTILVLSGIYFLRNKLGEE
ncbi:MAG: EamA family transporter [Nitrosopumilus sp.]